MDVAESFRIKVLLVGNILECELGSPSSLSVIGAGGEQMAGHLGTSDLPATVRLSEGKIVIAGREYSGADVMIVPGEPYIFSINGKSYRGKLTLLVNSTRDGFHAINVVPLEPYLAGVVGAEMPGYWEPAALEAQAVASRTYCLYIKQRFGKNRQWDVQRTQANQVYNGLKAETKRVWQAINKTWGQVLVCREGSGPEEIFPGYYSSTCGGNTEDSRGVFGSPCSALVGRDCPYCKYVAKPGIFYWPTVQYEKPEVTRRLLLRYPNLLRLGDIVDMVPAVKSEYDAFSRVTSVRLVGSTGQTDIVRGEDLRLAIDRTGSRIRSAAFKIVDRGDKWAFVSGRGYGHAVGMCQCGAQGMARQGNSARQILSYYYTGARIKRLY
jgi:stage II sporulation protein D